MIIRGKAGENFVASHNEIVTTGFSDYITFMMKGGSPTLYFALGTGNAEWDSGTVPTPSAGIDQLVSEAYRVAVPTTSMVYLDPTTEEESVDPTNLIKITVEVQSSDYNGFVREYALIYNGTTATNSGTPIVYGNHTKMRIPAGGTYTKIIKIGT